MYRILLLILAVATLASACASASTTRSAADATTIGSAVDATTSVASPSGHEEGNNSCPPGGCPVPNCGSDEVVHVVPQADPSGVGTQDPQTDVEQWSNTLVGGGKATGIPTPQNKLAYLISVDGTDLALLWYVSDGAAGWLRDGYTACASALL